MFRMKEKMFMWKKQVPSCKLEEELLNIFGNFSASNMKQYQPEPYNHKSKHYYRFRVMECGLRIKDFSFFNFIIETSDNGTVIFKTKKGNEDNWIMFNGDIDIIFNDKDSTIILNVLNKVYWLDGTRRYQNKHTDKMGKFKITRGIFFGNQPEMYNDSKFLKQRTVTEASLKHVRKIKERIKRRKKARK